MPKPKKSKTSDSKIDERERLSILLVDAGYEGILLADGFEKAFLGVVCRQGETSFAIYDRQKCIDILIERDGMDYDDAVEFFDFNVSGAWVGERTPGYLEKIDR